MPDTIQVTLEGETEDLDLVCRHCELERVVLFGWSYHGAVAANFAGRNPHLVERLILSGPVAPSYADQSAAVLQSRLNTQAISDLMNSPLSDRAAAAKAWHDIVMRGYCADGGAYIRTMPEPQSSDNERMGNVSRHVNALMASLREGDWCAAAARYPGPVLILHGEGDFIPLDGSREWQRSFGDARLLTIAKAGHFIWLEQPEIFFAAINQFLGSASLTDWSWPATAIDN